MFYFFQEDNTCAELAEVSLFHLLFVLILRSSNRIQKK